MVDLAKKLDKIETEALKKIADCFRQQGELENAVEVYKKLDEHGSVLQLYVDTKNWELAFTLVKKYPQFMSSLYIPYARWLVENDKFVEAQKGNRPFFLIHPVKYRELLFRQFRSRSFP